MTGSGTERLQEATRERSAPHEGRPSRYRDDDHGIAEGDLPHHLALCADALGHLATVGPYWETLDRDLCARLKTGYPLDALSCRLQVVGDESPEHYEPGCHPGVETIGDIDPVRIPGPPARP